MTLCLPREVSPNGEKGIDILLSWRVLREVRHPVNKYAEYKCRGRRPRRPIKADDIRPYMFNFHTFCILRSIYESI